jgi:type VI secretion system protein ImpC
MSEPNIGNEQRIGWRALTYQLRHQPAETIEVPFVVAVLADLGRNPERELPRLRDRHFREVDFDNVEEVLRTTDPRLHISVPNCIDANPSPSEISLELRFGVLDDFSPRGIAAQVPHMHHIRAMRVQLALLAEYFAIRKSLSRELFQFLSLPSVIAFLGQQAATPIIEANAELAGEIAEQARRAFSSALWSDLDLCILLQASASCNAVSADDLPAAVARRIAHIDAQVSEQLNHIIHAPALQRLEASWRGLVYLTRETETGSLLKIRVLNASKKELTKEMQKSIGDTNENSFYRKLVDEDGIFGYEPYALLLCDFEMTNDPLDIYVAERLAAIGKALSAPVVCAAAPGLLGLESWNELPLPRDLRRIFWANEYAKWHSMRESPQADHLIVTLPPLLARLPWDTRDSPDAHSIHYAELMTSRQDYVWLNSAYGLVSVVANSFARDRWCADLRGPVWGRIEGLPSHYVVEGSEIVDVVGPTAIDVSEHRHLELSSLGFTSIARHVRGEFAALTCPIVVARTQPADALQQPATGTHATQLEHVLSVGRVHHVVKSFLKDHLGVWSDLEEAASEVQAWLRTYCEQADQESGLPPRSASSAPFRSVRVTTRSSEQGRDQFPGLTLDIEFNYIPAAATIRRVIIAITPAGFQSGRIIP